VSLSRRRQRKTRVRLIDDNRDLAAKFFIALLDYFRLSHLSLIYAKSFCVPAFGDAITPGPRVNFCLGHKPDCLFACKHEPNLFHA